MGKPIYKRTPKQEVNMRISSKKRKLNEIRLSNRIASGLPVFAYTRASDMLSDNVEELKKIVLSIKPKLNIPRLNRKFKFKIVGTEMNKTGMDMLQDTFSIRNKYIAI